MNDIEYKALSIKEFTKAANVYETDKAGIYKMCKRDYPDILAELEKEPFETLLDCGCGTAPMISLLYDKYPEKHYTGIDLTPQMIEVAKAKNIPGAEFIVGDCENLPFEENTFDAIICSQSFHHYPNVQDFFNSVYRVLKPGGRLVLRDMTTGLESSLNGKKIALFGSYGWGDGQWMRDWEERCKKAGAVLAGDPVIAASEPDDEAKEKCKALGSALV